MTRKLKWWVLPSLYLIGMSAVLVCFYFIGSMISKGTGVTANQLVVSGFIEDTLPVLNEASTQIIKPYTSESVHIARDFYDNAADSERQQNSLIYFENIYMQNTGILYSSDSQFDVVSVMDGEVKNIKEDEILGYVVEIEHSTKLTTFYRSLENVHIKVGDKVSQGDIIGTSGQNNLGLDSKNCLHFEVYLDGKSVNPESFYQMNIEDLS